ncbi:MAG: hypothetical protein WCG27_11965 [Pseudomonadota bacterium]
MDLNKVKNPYKVIYTGTQVGIGGATSTISATPFANSKDYIVVAQPNNAIIYSYRGPLFGNVTELAEKSFSFDSFLEYTTPNRFASKTEVNLELVSKTGFKDDVSLFLYLNPMRCR